MTQFSKIAMLALFGLVIVGCRGPIGTWKMEEITPRSGAAHFGLHKVTFNPGNTFQAEVLADGRVQEIEGTYVYDQDARLLTLNGDDGSTRVYAFEPCPGCGYMYLKDPDGAHDYRAKLVRR